MKSFNGIKNILSPKKIVVHASVLTTISAITSSSALAVTIGGAFTGNRGVSYGTATRSYDIGFDGPISFCSSSRECIDVPFFVSSGTGNTIRVGYRSLFGTSFFSVSDTKPAILRFGTTGVQITNATTSRNLWTLETSLPSTDVLFRSGSISNGNGATFTLTQVPEPLTVLGSGVALGFGALFKKEYSRKQKKAKNLERQKV